MFLVNIPNSSLTKNNIITDGQSMEGIPFPLLNPKKAAKEDASVYSLFSELVH